MSETPMIWTKDGNMPIESLEYRVEWNVGRDAFGNVDSVTWAGIHTNAAGEIVRREAHVCLIEAPPQVGAASGRLN